jgi:glucose-6-phosphate isomerase/transaldolase/glucose-6-phosphate isomerase
MSTQSPRSSFSPPDIGETAIARLWARDPTLWKPRPEDDVELSNRLGWLTLPTDFLAQAAELEQFATQQAARGITHVVVCGMGGSSLAPEVFRITFPTTTGRPTLHVLDSTDPGAVKAVDAAIDPRHTLFVISSKSGGTLEVMSFLAHFWELAEHRGDQFCAITDPGTSLDKLATERGFLTTFRNPTEIGGRYSALSYFGLVPAALVGIDLKRLLQAAQDEAKKCQAEQLEANPGATLGAYFGGHARAGRDKLTILTSPSIDSFGLWVEQLIAESTGKEGKGVVPVVGEAIGEPAAYGADRCFVVLRVDGDDNSTLDRGVDRLHGQHPVLVHHLSDIYALGAEMYRWEVATALAGAILRINPFDQPNVQESKDNTARVLEAGLTTPPGVLQPEAVADFLKQAHGGDYVAIHAYLTPTAETEARLQGLRALVRDRRQVATTLGFGPRFLHSTGQLHKGGPVSGVFLQLTYSPSEDVPIPGQPFSFGTLLAAQALGDLESLRSRGLRVARVDLGTDVAGGLERLTRAAD